jgi:signal peptidase I
MKQRAKIKNAPYIFQHFLHGASKEKYNFAEILEARLENLEEAQMETQVEDAPVSNTINWGRFFLDIIETLALAAVLFLGINAVSARVRVDGFSMMPSLEDGEFVLVSKVNYRFGNVERGDIIVFHFPMDPKQELIKRVMGLPGDTIVVQNGQVAINGQVLNEPYIAAAPLYTGEWTVPNGQLFMLGDNRNDSSDSHSWGYLPTEEVVGKAVLIYWPPPVWKVIQHTTIAPAQ